jgi:hypothetical protein
MQPLVLAFCLFLALYLKKVNLHQMYRNTRCTEIIFSDLVLDCDRRSSDALNTVFHL